MLKKTLGIILIIAVIAVGFYQKEAWLDAIKAGGLISVLCSMLLIAADVFFPIVPFAIIAALNGAVRNCKWCLDYTGRFNARYDIAVFSREVQLSRLGQKKNKSLSCYTRLRGFIR